MHEHHLCITYHIICHSATNASSALYFYHVISIISFHDDEMTWWYFYHSFILMKVKNAVCMKKLRRMKKYRYGGGNIVYEEWSSTHLYFVRNLFFSISEYLHCWILYGWQVFIAINFNVVGVNMLLEIRRKFFPLVSRINCFCVLATIWQKSKFMRGWWCGVI